MKDILKDYGTLIGPIFAFSLGVIAIYIKFYSDRQLESWRSKRKMKKLVQLIFDSKPPLKYYPKKSNIGILHADQARNLTNLSIFYKRLEVIKEYITVVENEILTNCSIKEIRQFRDLKFIVAYLFRDVEDCKKKGIPDMNEEDKIKFTDFYEHDFLKLKKSYERLITVCINPEKEFNYIEN